MRALFAVLAVLMAALLSACGGGSDSGNGNTAVQPGGETQAPPVEYTGRALKGAIDDALVMVEVLEAGQWRELARTHTEQGWFLLDSPALADDVLQGLLRITVKPADDRLAHMVCDVPDGCGATGYQQMMALSDDFRLSLLLTPEQFALGDLAVTPVTHLMARWVEAFPGGPGEAGLALASKRISKLFDLPEDFINRLPADPADPAAFRLAGEDQQLHGVLAAAFAAVAGDSSPEMAIESLADLLVKYAGQLPVAGDHGLASLLGQADAILAHLSDEDQNIRARMAAITGDWQDITGVNATAGYDWDRQRAAAFLDEFQYYFGGGLAADLDASAQRQWQQYGWLKDAELLSIMAVMLDVIGYAIEAAVTSEARFMAANQDCRLWAPHRCTLSIEFSDSDDYSVVMDPFPSLSDALAFLFSGGTINPRVYIQGTMHGQEVDIALRVPTPSSQLFSGGMERLRFELTEASLANSAALGNMDGVFEIELPGLDLATLFSTLRPLLEASNDIEDIIPVALDLIGDISGVTLSLVGNAGLASVAMPDQPLSGQLDGELALNIDGLLGNGADLFALTLHQGELVSPFGDRFFSLEGEPGFELYFGQNAGFGVAFGFDIEELPEIHWRLSGEAAGIGALNQGLWQLFSGLSQGQVNIDGLQGLSLSDIQLAGDLSFAMPGYQSRYDISVSGHSLHFNFAHSSEPGLEFNFASDRGGYLMLDEVVIATMTLIPEAGTVRLHFVDGTDQAAALAPLLDLFDMAGGLGGHLLPGLGETSGPLAWLRELRQAVP